MWRPPNKHHLQALRRNLKSSSHRPTMHDIEELHQLAVRQGLSTYTDPATGFMVFTEVAHLRRGKCCGNRCRHCPYGWKNVRQETALSSHSIPVPSSSNKTGGRLGGKDTDKNVPYTRTGDTGMSALFTGERRLKTDACFEAMGTVDELCSVVGVAHALVREELKDKSEGTFVNEWLLEIMSRLFDIGSHVAKPRRCSSGESATRTLRTESCSTCSREPSDSEQEEDKATFQADGVGGGFDVSHVEELEKWIDQVTEALPELTSFVLPTGTKAAAQMHVARTVCRRAERRVVHLVHNGVCDPRALHYLNRLSDFFFTLARWVNHVGKVEEIQYRKPTKGATHRDRFPLALDGND